jgi:hypothetical protein
MFSFCIAANMHGTRTSASNMQMVCYLKLESCNAQVRILDAFVRQRSLGVSFATLDHDFALITLDQPVAPTLPASSMPLAPGHGVQTFNLTTAGHAPWSLSLLGNPVSLFGTLLWCTGGPSTCVTAAVQCRAVCILVGLRCSFTQRMHRRSTLQQG